MDQHLEVFSEIPEPYYSPSMPGSPEVADIHYILAAPNKYNMTKVRLEDKQSYIIYAGRGSKFGRNTQVIRYLTRDEAYIIMASVFSNSYKTPGNLYYSPYDDYKTLTNSTITKDEFVRRMKYMYDYATPKGDAISEDFYIYLRDVGLENAVAFMLYNPNMLGMFENNI